MPPLRRSRGGLMPKQIIGSNYRQFLNEIQHVLRQSRSAAARSVNAIMTTTYWEIGRRIVVFEQKGEQRADYGERLIERLSRDLTKNFGRGFGLAQVNAMRQFYLAYPHPQILQSAIGESRFPLSWTHYLRLLRVKNYQGRAFYEAECLRAGWSIRQLDRQIDTQFYERTALSKNKKAMLIKGSRSKKEDAVTPEEEIKSPYVLEFLGLKDEYSESDLEDSLIRHLESFLMELGGDFAFVARQKRLRIGDSWYRVDLMFYHRRLRCLVLIDLKIGRFTHADAGQMHMYLNYARRHWTHENENPPVGLILCAEKNEAVAEYALENLPSKVLAAQYKMVLPKEGQLIKEIQRTQAKFPLRRKT